MKIKLSRILVVSIFTFFTSCSAPVLIGPENTEKITRIPTPVENTQLPQMEPSTAVVGGSSQSSLVAQTATLAVVGGNSRSPLAPPTATAEAVLVTPAPSPTFTQIAKPTESPTPPQPISTPGAHPTPTETPLPTGGGVEIAEITPLTFDDTTPTGQELRALLNAQPDWSYADYGGDGPFDLLGWTPTNEVVVQPIIPNTQQAERPVWAIEPVDGQARPIPNWNLEPVLTQVQQRIVDNFLTQRQTPPKIVRSYPSPGHEYLALLAIQENTTQNQLHIYRVGTEKEIVVLPQAVADKQSAVTNLAPVWSPDGRKLAYGVAIYQADKFPTESYELHIIEPETNHLTRVKPVYYKGYPSSITWSPESQYVTFSAQRSDNGPLSLFVVKTDGTELIDLTPNAEYWVLDSVFWSPSGAYIAYGASGRIIWLAKLNIE